MSSVLKREGSELGQQTGWTEEEGVPAERLAVELAAAWAVKRGATGAGGGGLMALLSLTPSPSWGATFPRAPLPAG